MNLIKRPWVKAGFEILSNRSIKNHLDKLEKDYYNLTKNKKRQNEKDKKNQEAFKTEIDKVFWIGKPGLRDSIENDKNRDAKAIQEDLLFLADQLGPRKQKIGSFDKRYEDKCCMSTSKRHRYQKDFEDEDNLEDVSFGWEAELSSKEPSFEDEEYTCSAWEKRKDNETRII